MKERKIRIDRILSIVVIAVLLATTIMFAIKLLSGKSYKELPKQTYIIKDIQELQAEKVYIAALLTKKHDLSLLNDSQKNAFNEKKEKLVEASKTQTNLENLQQSRINFELASYDVEKKLASKDYTAITVENGVHRVNGHVIVNKRYALPSTYNPKEVPEAKNAFLKLINAMQSEQLPVSSSYKGYFDFKAQEIIYSELFYKEKQSVADATVARAGHSESQTGLTYTILNRTGSELGSHAEDQKAIEWVKQHASKYGFIIRYPEGKEEITGFKASNAILRYVGVEVAKAIQTENKSFEEFFNIKGGTYEQ